MSRKSAVPFLIFAVFLLVGCGRQAPEEWVLSAETLDLSEELQEKVSGILTEHAGTQANPKMVGDPEFDAGQLKAGRAVYEFYCQQCHGVTGDGNGPAANAMRPRPRDYRRGVFKFTSTPYGYKPRREDLRRTLRMGVPGTSMPAFDRLSDGDIESVLDYVLALTHRGELEEQLAVQASDLEDYPEIPDEIIADIKADWEKAEASIVYPLTPQPQFTQEHVLAGKKSFLDPAIGCLKCHGEDGRGQTKENIGNDRWKFATKAADITSGMLHGGSRPIDIYRRIHSGINGTPMPNFSNSLKERPEVIWDLVAYVMYLSNVRRNGEIPAAASIPEPGSPAAVLEAHWKTDSKEKS